jgi:glutamate-ammonia-ligase adenylyltransferase
VLPPTDSEEFIFLARRVDYTTDDWQAGARHLRTDIEENMGRVREFWEVMRFRRLRDRRLRDG